MSRMRSSIGISRRSSISGNPDAKRSSIGGTARGVRDPRPVLDKGYVKEGVAHLSSFLRDRGYDGACSLKDLKQPSTLCVTNIFKYLMKHLLPRYEIGRLDELPNCLAMVGYPCKLQKSWLTAVGSPHAWPHLLAAMQWICHCIECSELSEPYEAVFGGAGDELTMFPGEDEGKSAKQRRQEFHAECYNEFMHLGDTDVEKSDYKRQCDLKENQLIQAVRELDGAMEACEREVKIASADPTPLKRAEMAVQCVAADKQKFQVLIQQLEEHIPQQTLFLQQKAEQEQDEERLFAGLTGEQQELEARVAAQPLSSADVQRLAAQSEQLSVERRDLRQKLEALEKETWQAEMDCNKKAKALAEDKQIVASSGFDLSNCTFASIQERLLVDEDALRRQRMSLQDELETLRQMLVKQQEFVSTLEKDLKLAKATHKRSLQQLEDEHQREATRLEQFLNVLHSRLESKGEGQRVADAQDALQQAQQRLEAGRLQSKQDIDEKVTLLRLAMNKITDHLAAYENVIARVEL